MRSTNSNCTIARALFPPLLLLWLLCMLIVTCLEAGDLQRQSIPVYSGFLEDQLQYAKARFEKSNIEIQEKQAADVFLLLEAPNLEPRYAIPLFMKKESLQPRAFNMILNQSGIVVRSNGLLEDAYAQTTSGLRIHEGYLSYVNNGELLAVFPATDAISYHFFTFRKGSYYLESYQPGEDRYITRNRETGVILPSNTDMTLLAGIENRTMNFDMTRLTETTILRGAWLIDSSGLRRWYILAGLGWSPLTEAMKCLWPVYLFSAFIFGFGGIIATQFLNHRISSPMQRLGSSLISDPLVVTEDAFDYRYQVSDLRRIIAGHLLSHQMQAAKLNTLNMNAEAAVSIGSLTESVLGNLLPILIDRGITLEKYFPIDYSVRCIEEDVRLVIRELIRDSLISAQDGTIYRLQSYANDGFIVLVLDTVCKHHIHEAVLHDIWTSVYHIPENSAKPGAKLREAVNTIPGAFCAVQRTRKGIRWLVGLPKV